MKKIYKNIAFLFVGIFMQIHLLAQVNCNGMVNISTSIWDCTAQLTPDIFVEGPTDIYDQVTLDITELGYDDLDVETEITVTAIVGSDTSTCVSIALLEDKTAPVAVTEQELTIILDENGEATITAGDVDNGSWDNCGDITLSVDPSEFTCEDIGQEDLTVMLTVVDESGNTNTGFTDVVVYQDLSPIACLTDISVNTDDGPVLIELDDVLFNQEPGTCDENYTLTILDASGEIVPDNIIWSAYAGTTLTANVSTPMNNSCWGTINVDGEVDCPPLTGDKIEWPSDLTLAILGADSDSLSPANLVEFFDIDPADAMPTIVDFDCEQVLATTYSDDIFIISNTSFQVSRTWTILDWTTGNTFFYLQIIDNAPNTDFICDTLPRTAPVGDCDSGHSLEDDVEWPADLAIADYRISPEELIEFSGVDPLDAEPSFYNAPDSYSAEYIDYLVDLGPDELTLGRQWTVTRSDIGGSALFWIYTQTIVVDLGAFSNLVTVETIKARPVPDVEVTQDIITDEDGNATVEDNDILNPFLADDPQNGLDILDLFIMRQHILAINFMDDLQLIAADVNENNSLTTLDLVLVERVILGIDTELSSTWNFIDKPIENSLSPKAQYIAIKPGDVNDSAVLGANNFSGENGLEYSDQLVNAGETLKIPFSVSEEMIAHGAEISFTIDNAALEVTEVLSGHFANSVSFNQSENGELNIVLMNPEDATAQEIEAGDALFQITVEAKENTVLSWALDLNENRNSFYIAENQELILFNEVVDGEIISGLEDYDALEGITAYPNPASDYLHFELSNGTFGDDYNLSLFNTAGQVVLTSDKQQNIDISRLPNGLYYYAIVSDQKLAKGKVIISK